MNIFRSMELELSTHQANKYKNCVHKKDRRGGLFGYCPRLKARLPLRPINQSLFKPYCKTVKL